MNTMHNLIKRLYPICRSITGNGVRETLAVLKEHLPLEVHQVPSGTPVYDWTVPDEWNIREAWIKGPDGRRVVDFANHTLHVLNYSIPVHRRLSLEELRAHLYSLPEQPDLIPYRTSYYNRNWGFCLAHRVLESLPEGEYEVFIDSDLKPGHLTWGELYLPPTEHPAPSGQPGEILVTTHICHPSMCNDNLSGIAVATALAEQLQSADRRYAYRFLFIPGTIGSIAWLAQNEETLPRIKHCLVLANLGDAGKVHWKLTRHGDAEIDRAVKKVLADSGDPFEIVPFSPYGYDERQFSSPGINLPAGNFSRSPWGSFPEYHTSADNLGFVKPESLEDSLQKLLDICRLLERNRYYLNTSPRGEPQLGKRGLYNQPGGQMPMLWVLNQSDGTRSLLDIAEQSGLPFNAIYEAAQSLEKAGLLKRHPEPGTPP